MIWSADPDGYLTNGPGTMKKGDRIRIVMPDGRERVVEVIDTPVDDERGTFSLQVREVGE